jgi:hypothetical protein
MVWVRFPSPAPFCSGEDGKQLPGFVPVLFAHIAQSVEHFLGKEEVSGSNPLMGSRVFIIVLFIHL